MGGANRIEPVPQSGSVKPVVQLHVLGCTQVPCWHGLVQMAEVERIIQRVARYVHERTLHVGPVQPELHLKVKHEREVTCLSIMGMACSRHSRICRQTRTSLGRRSGRCRIHSHTPLSGHE